MVHDPFYDLVLSKPALSFDLKRTALLVVDLQYMDAHPDGWMGRLCRDQGKPHHLDERWANIRRVLPNVSRLQAACRAARIEIVHIRTAFLTRDARDGSRSLVAHGIRTPVDSRDAEFLEEVAPLGDEIVITKTSAGAFNSTAIDKVLFNMDVRQLIVTGIVTEGCVEMTARDAADRGFLVTLVSDGCTSSTQAAHEEALARMTDGDILTAGSTDEIIRLIEQAQRK